MKENNYSGHVKVQIATMSDIYNDLYRAFLSELGLDTARSFSCDCQGEIVFIAQDEVGEVLGLASYFVPDQFLHILYVVPKARRTEVGTEILKAIQRNFGIVFRLKCLTSNTSAKAFYLALGFKVTANGTTSDGDYETLEINHSLIG